MDGIVLKMNNEEPELIIISPCGDKYKWNYQTRNWEPV